MYTKIQETASWLKERMTTSPKTAIVLGTGLGQLASEITDRHEFPYKDIPNFPVSTVEGHSGKLIFGKLGGVDIMAMQGRFHSVRIECCRRYESRFQDWRPDDYYRSY